MEHSVLLGLLQVHAAIADVLRVSKVMASPNVFQSIPAPKALLTTVVATASPNALLRVQVNVRVRARKVSRAMERTACVTKLTSVTSVRWKMGAVMKMPRASRIIQHPTASVVCAMLDFLETGPAVVLLLLMAVEVHAMPRPRTALVRHAGASKAILVMARSVCQLILVMTSLHHDSYSPLEPNISPG